jgi:hypothetical protein
VQRSLQSRIAEAQAGGEPAVVDLQCQLAEVNGKRQALFEGETVRGLLMTSYGFATLGTKAEQARTAAYGGAGVVLVRRCWPWPGRPCRPSDPYTPPMRFRRLPLMFLASAVATVVSSTAAQAAPKPSTPTVGYDVSYPQCSGSLPRDPAFGIVGVSDGLAYGRNPCLAAQYSWAATARQRPGFYMNTGNPGVAASRVDWYSTAGPAACSPADEASCAYNYGYNAARDAVDHTTSVVGTAAVARAVWWLDVETANSWAGDTSLNLADISGSIDFLSSAGVAGVGIYSTGYQWGVITGGAQLPGMANWVAGAVNAKRAEGMCGASFTGGPVRLVQYASGGFDADYACP